MSSTEGGLELSDDDMKRVGKDIGYGRHSWGVREKHAPPQPLLSRKQPDALPLRSEHPFKPMTRRGSIIPFSQAHTLSTSGLIRLLFRNSGLPGMTKPRGHSSD